MQLAARFLMPVRILVFQCCFLLEKDRFLLNLATIFTRSAIGLSLLGFFSCFFLQLQNISSLNEVGRIGLYLKEVDLRWNEAQKCRSTKTPG